MAVLDFSGKPGKATLARSFEAFLAGIAQIERLRPHIVRAYRYELAAAADDVRFGLPLDELRLEDLEAWLVRPPAATSTVGRRVATFRRYFAWACRHSLCVRNPLAEHAPIHARRRLPRPIREQHEQCALERCGDRHRRATVPADLHVVARDWYARRRDPGAALG